MATQTTSCPNLISRLLRKRCKKDLVMLEGMVGSCIIYW